MTRDDVIRRLRRHCRKEGLEFDWSPRKGKGGHGTVQVGDKFTIVKSGELSEVYVVLVLKQLGLDKDAI